MGQLVDQELPIKDLMVEILTKTQMAVLAAEELVQEEKIQEQVGQMVMVVMV